MKGQFGIVFYDKRIFFKCVAKINLNFNLTKGIKQIQCRELGEQMYVD